MRLIRGAPGSGKTALVFREFKAALEAGQTDLRIVVPTATLVRHYQHELARDGVVFSPRSVVSLKRFIGECAPHPEPVSDGLLTAITRDCLQRIRLPEFLEIAATEGMVPTVLDTIKLFENANCTPDKLATVRKLPPHSKAFAKLWRAIDDAFRATGHATRAGVVRAAIAAPPLEQKASIWLDGFLAFSPLESEFIRSLAQTSDLTLTLTDLPATIEIYKLACRLGAKDQLLAGKSRKPRATIIEARTVEREADEIARRIIELNRAGMDFRQIGVALRETGTYFPLLRTAFERFGIPARFYFSTPLKSHPAAIFLNGLIAGALNGWEFETALETFRAHPKWGATPAFDRFDFKVRDAMPGSGAEALISHCESESGLKAAVTDWVATEAWATALQTPAEWTRRLERLATTFYSAGTLDNPRDFTAVAASRTHVAALHSWVATVNSITAFWPAPASAIPLEEFWNVAASALDSAVFQPPDDRAGVVHVMSAHEARQWDLSALFVCGMIDREFPKRHPQNLLFPDSEIDRLLVAGIPLRKASDLANEETALFESLRTRAAESLFLTYPKHDTAGRTAVPSRFLREFEQQAIPALACRPQLRFPLETPAATGRIHSPDLLAGMTALHKTISLSGLEDLAQCRFKFFGSRTLSLKGAPDRPGDRLQPRLTGLILHQALELWLLNKGQDFVELFEKTFDETCRRQHIPAGYRLEVERIKFREIAERIRASDQWAYDSSEVEVSLALEFPDGVTVNCRIDRIDRFGNDCVIVDYKSSKTDNVKKLPLSRTRLQGPLYALAVRESMHLNPVAMIFWAVRDDERFGWGHIPGTDQTFFPIPPNWLEDARGRIVERLGGYLAGQVYVRPEEPESCRWCDFRNTCRVEQQAALVMIEGGNTEGAGG